MKGTLHTPPIAGKNKTKAQENETNRIAVIVDLQNDFVTQKGASLYVTGSEETVEETMKLVAEGIRNRHLNGALFTYDDHEEKSKTFAATHGKKAGETVTLNDGSTVSVWPKHCVKGTYGHNFHESFYEIFCDETTEEEAKKAEGACLVCYTEDDERKYYVLKGEFEGKIQVFGKGEDPEVECYGFLETTGRKATGADKFIKEKFGTPTEFIIAGEAKDYCAGTSADQTRRYFPEAKVNFVEELCHSIDEENTGKAKMEEIKEGINPVTIVKKHHLSGKGLQANEGKNIPSEVNKNTLSELSPNDYRKKVEDIFNIDDENKTDEKINEQKNFIRYSIEHAEKAGTLFEQVLDNPKEENGNTVIEYCHPTYWNNVLKDKIKQNGADAINDEDRKHFITYHIDSDNNLTEVIYGEEINEAYIFSEPTEEKLGGVLIIEESKQSTIGNIDFKASRNRNSTNIDEEARHGPIKTNETTRSVT